MEDIPDKDLLYYRVHKDFLKDGDILPGVFRDKKDSLSADWNKYSTPLISLLRSKVIEDNAIISLKVDLLRNCSQKVLHNPIGCNYAHSDVIGKKDSETRIKIKNSISGIEINLNLQE